MSEFSLSELSPEQRKALVQQVSERVRQTLQIQSVPPTSEIRGTWHEPGLLRGVHTAGADRIGTDGSVSEQSTQIAKYIDHTLLKPTATRADVLKICKEAKTHGFASVCLNTTWIRIAAQALAGSTVKPIAVVGFPLGAMVTAAKAAETREAVASGAKEIDMVINIGALKSGDHTVVFSDIRAVVEAAQGYPVKVILETAMLNRAEKIAGCAISKAAGAHFVKTSTGFGGGGATVEDVELMRSVVGPEMGVKASGGVRSAEDLKKMVAAGATRVGASASVAIVSGQTGQSAY